ncbi:MAG: polysaccharide biosynthesis/export family protein [Thermodesulfobacteriota bacterium]
MKLHLVVFQIVICCCLLVNPALAASKKGKSASGAPSYLVGKGDQLEVQVWQEEELSRLVNVRLDGYITIPLIGDIKADGRTTAAIAGQIKKKLSSYINDPSVTVILAAGLSRQYYVVGQIATSGEFPISRPITVLQAISRAGGFLEWAKRNDVRVVRRMKGKERMLGFDYGDVARGRLGSNFLIEPGDTIIVP